MHILPTVAPWYRQRWPWFLMLGPVIVVIAGSITMWIAWTRQDAMVVDDYYKQGKAINQDLRRDRAASALGLAFEARYDAAGGALEGSLRGLAGPVTTPYRILLAHSTQPEKDLKLDVVPDRLGQFRVVLPMLEQARWQVVVEGAQRDWRLAASWRWPAQRSVGIKADALAAP